MFRSLLARRFSVVSHAKVLIIGGGPGGINTAAQLIRQGVVEPGQITILEGSATHHYKPGWTLYASEDIKKQTISRPIDYMIPRNVQLIDHYVEKVIPEQNRVVLRDGRYVTYQHLVIASGIKFNFGNIKGLQEALSDPERPVTSIYEKDSHEKHRRLRHRKFDAALFTEASHPITCAGAPQKILHATAEGWNKQGFHPKLMFFQAEPYIFKVDFYGQDMKLLLDKRQVDHRLAHKLVEVRKENVAVFEITGGPKAGTIVEQEFDFLHAVPPMSGHSYLEESGITNKSNFVQVDSKTLQSKFFENVWALGDASDLPTSKTEAAVIDQSLVLVNRLDSVLNKKPATKTYDGYTACPVLVGGHKVMLAEFKYGDQLAPTFFKDQRKPRRMFYWMKKYLFPFANNYLVPRGRWRGRKTFWDASGYDYSDFKTREEKRRSDIPTRLKQNL